MPNMTNMFDATPKVLLDQSETFDNTGETRTYTWGVVDRPDPSASRWHGPMSRASSARAPR